jgi:hypothetical protein
MTLQELTFGNYSLPPPSLFFQNKLRAWAIFKQGGVNNEKTIKLGD